MLCSKPPRVIRTTLDLANAKQVKSVRRRLKISDADLIRIVDKIGNSLHAIEKETAMNGLIDLVGLVVVIAAILSFFGLR